MRQITEIILLRSLWITIIGILVNQYCIAEPISLFENEYNHFSGNQLKRFKVCGERCSGTNYIMHLLHANFPELKHTQQLEFGHKHFLWWFGCTDFKKLIPLKYKINAVDMSGSSDCLFVGIVRNSYDWLRSFYTIPWEVHRNLCNRGFSHFLKSEWRCRSAHHIFEGSYSEIDNFNPWSNRPFKNILELRKYKIKNYLTLGKIVKNFIFVRYEDVRDHPQAFIKFVNKKYRLKNKKKFIPITTHKGTHVPYAPKKYFAFSQEDLKFISENIDCEMERAAGYDCLIK